MTTTDIVFDESKTISAKFKAPCDQTPKELAERWNQSDQALWSYIEKNIPLILEHTGSAAFDDHLKGVQAVLRYWNAPDHLVSAGLFHSIYGTEGFNDFHLPLTERKTIQGLIGHRAETICYNFCMADRYTIDQTVFDYYLEDALQEKKDDDTPSCYTTIQARPELGRFSIPLTKEEWLDLIELVLVDKLEQVEGAALKASSYMVWKAGEAYSYRRDAFEKMKDILARERAPRLSKVAPMMYEEVMATESHKTRHLVQVRTAPKPENMDALRAHGITILDTYEPQPRKGTPAENFYAAR